MDVLGKAASPGAAIGARFAFKPGFAPFAAGGDRDDRVGLGLPARPDDDPRGPLVFFGTAESARRRTPHSSDGPAPHETTRLQSMLVPLRCRSCPDSAGNSHHRESDDNDDPFNDSDTRDVFRWTHGGRGSGHHSSFTRLCIDANDFHNDTHDGPRGHTCRRCAM